MSSLESSHQLDGNKKRITENCETEVPTFGEAGGHIETKPPARLLRHQRIPDLLEKIGQTDDADDPSALFNHGPTPAVVEEHFKDPGQRVIGLEGRDVVLQAIDDADLSAAAAGA